ncbi:hypothetical protein [Streptomyces sp. NPDC086182]|uniref:hypothetical protein n=1 Tax=Streptomyces sp. NPDC086182 TaxID=3155058 RepID=UPI00342DCAB0
MRDNAAAWLQTVDWLLGAALFILAAALAIAVGVAAYGLLRLARWTVGRIRHRFDVARMQTRPQLRPATGQAIDDYWTCRRVWAKPTREESKR